MEDRRRDLDAIIAVARRRAARAPSRFAERLTRAVQDAPDERLERLMRSAARRPILEGVFWQMPQRLDRRRADGVEAAVLWRIGGRPDGGTDDYRLLISNGAARIIRGVSDEPPRTVLTMTIDGVDFLKLISGGLDPMRGYLGGKIQLAGDIMFAAKLGSMFRVPPPRLA
jgi:hypothetical protein